MILNLNKSTPDMDKSTVFNEDGSITETYSNGSKIVTIFGTNVITEKHYNGNGKVTQTKTTTFKSDGSITEVYS